MVSRSGSHMDKKRKIRGDDPNLGKRKPGKGERTIEVNGLECFWRASDIAITIRAPNGKRFETRNSYGVITPYDVREVILANMDKLV